MEVMSILEKYREQINIERQKPENSLAEIVKKYPQLKDVPEKVIIGFEDTIRNIHERRQECARCEKTGDSLEHCHFAVPLYDNGAIIHMSEKCEKQEIYKHIKNVERLLGYSRIGKRFLDRKFETFKTNAKNKLAYQKCKDYADNFPHKDGQGLLIIGGYGTGKTHLAVSILHALFEKNVHGMFATVPELLEEIRTSFNSDKGISGNDLLKKIKKTDFLILDDLGAEKATDWVREQLFMIINSRYESMLPTVITSNLLLSGNDSLETKVGARTISRIIEMCSGVMLDGDDYRKRKLL